MVKQLILKDNDVQESAIDFLDSFFNLITTHQCSKDITIEEECHWQQIHVDSLEFLKTLGLGDFDTVFEAHKVIFGKPLLEANFNKNELLQFLRQMNLESCRQLKQRSKVSQQIFAII
jgi:hypothetical protein